MKSIDILRDQWASLGVAFAYGSKIQCDPETAILNFVNSSEFPEDKKMIGIVLAWLQEYSSFVHLEKLKTAAQSLEGDALLVLGALALKCIKLGDHRWKVIEKLVLKNISGYKSSLSDSEVLLKQHGLDEDFFKFGIRVTPVLPEDQKKLLVRERIFKMNPWLRHRLLFGTNLRADVATVKFLKLTNTAYGAAKLLGCSMNAAYRNWNDLTEAGWVG
jgi:hypothetical protein